MRMGTRSYHYQRLYVTWQVLRYSSKDDHIYDDDNGDDSDDDNDNDQITLCRLFALLHCGPSHGGVIAFIYTTSQSLGH